MIKFYRTVGTYGCFSNFSPHGFYLKDKFWKTSEHYFQAMKFEGTEHENQIRISATPREAANMGRDRSRPLRADWEEVKDSIMKEALIAKFEQNNLMPLLVKTGTQTIIEDSPTDYYWGIGAKGTGKNMLGILLMEIRNEYN